MELGCYLTKELYVSLGMMESTTKKRGSLVKSRKKDGSTTRKTESSNGRKKE